jgi:hypothetical protein
MLEEVAHLAKRMLRLRDRHSVSGTMITCSACFIRKAASSAEPRL